MGRATRANIFRVIAAVILFGPTLAEAAPSINVGLNQGLRVPVPGTIANVVATNPNIADVTVVDAHNVIIIGKAYGLAEVMVTDSTGRLLLDDIVNVAAPLDNVLTVYRGNNPQRYFCMPSRCEGMPAAPSQSASPPS